MATHEFYDRSCWMLNPDEEGHAPPPAPQLGAFLDAPRRALRAREGLDPDVFGMAKLPLELQRRIKQQAGIKSLARHEECKPTCVEVNHRNDEMELIYDTTGRAFAESGWEPMMSAQSNQVEARANGGYRTMVRLRDPQGLLDYWLWSGPDPLLTYDEEIDWLDLPGLKKAGGKRAKVASRGASRPRNVSALVDAPFEHDPHNHGSDYWRRHEAQLDWINARVPASCYEWPRSYDDYEDYDSEPPLPRDWWNPCDWWKPWRQVERRWGLSEPIRPGCPHAIGSGADSWCGSGPNHFSARDARFDVPIPWRWDVEVSCNMCGNSWGCRLVLSKEQEDAVRRMRRQERLGRKRYSYYERVRKPRRQQQRKQIRERLRIWRERCALLARRQADRVQFVQRHRAQLARLDRRHSAKLVQHEQARKAWYASAQSGRGGNGNIYHLLCQDYDGDSAAGGDGTQYASGRLSSSRRAPFDGLASAYPERGWQGSLRDAWQSLSARAREERSRM